MKTRTLMALAVSATAAAAGVRAQGANPHAAAEKQILANELAVNVAFEKHDPASISKYLSADAVTVDPGGAAPMSELLKVLGELKVDAGWKIDMDKVVWANDTTAIHVYRFTGNVTMMGQRQPNPSWCSTVWSLKGAEWKVVLHQETVAMPAPPPPPAPGKKK